MSKRSERGQRKKDNIKKEIRDYFFVVGVGLIFLILGIVGITSNHKQYNEYSSSSDILKVSAKVNYVSIHHRNDSYGRREDYWNADLTYSVNGQEYKGKKEYMTPTKVGDVKEIEVYIAKDGKYKIPEIRKGDTLIVADFMPIISMAFGAFLAIISLFMANGARKELK